MTHKEQTLFQDSFQGSFPSKDQFHCPGTKPIKLRELLSQSAFRQKQFAASSWDTLGAAREEHLEIAQDFYGMFRGRIKGGVLEILRGIREYGVVRVLKDMVGLNSWWVSELVLCLCLKLCLGQSLCPARATAGESALWHFTTVPEKAFFLNEVMTLFLRYHCICWLPLRTVLQAHLYMPLPSTSQKRYLTLSNQAFVITKATGTL